MTDHKRSLLEVAASIENANSQWRSVDEGLRQPSTKINVPIAALLQQIRLVAQLAGRTVQLQRRKDSSEDNSEKSAPTVRIARTRQQPVDAPTTRVLPFDDSRRDPLLSFLL